ncbi:transglycosylase SLT domain-containing protein [Halodesulfovibrio sp.]|uniref:transglycosylase SLT domain-containing protein n=1 Tax=Halodesulfovibrio sp. TaxID=1912772 RepID=UPI0025D51E5E|nr:transglycosylase SLT domain-containing protein [Halodesulfovibrio sp.]MCT4627952.1 transglycosylase SLT domain-containing protein [Halodesulfovibrio sp.]
MHRWLPHLDWRWYKAQLYQESMLNPKAVSPVGAKGLAQFMPATWKEIATLRGYGYASPHSPKYAIDAGAYYMAKLRRGWSSPRPGLKSRFTAHSIHHYVQHTARYSSSSDT